ncbi:terpenoid cyclases/Protein prenyltransferase [Neocallimastix lanati (nom. inval.)]|jgi:protein farnesyltransferase subunit beta|nr:terpenoid cyclases/Protein prenyltransferase [Neocallimastix sp. JGI-2020a]
MGVLDLPFSLDDISFNDGGIKTESSIVQKEVENDVKPLFQPYHNMEENKINSDHITLNKHAHIKFLRIGLKGLSSQAVGLDASQAWICYWIFHALDLLGATLSKNDIERAINTLSACQNPTGGFGGGPYQFSHVAPTYAAVNTLAIIGTEEAYNVIDREKLYEWFMSLKQPDGSFQMNDGGEIDVRGCYCVLATAKLLNILTPELTAGVAEFIASCQTYEGGMGGYPGNEAHGGYTFCALAALEILKKTDYIDCELLMEWLTSCQMRLEGGFQGRVNKLVDGCYSFWQAGSFPLLEGIYTKNKKPYDIGGFFDREALQEYILLCCQNQYGGLIDKPRKSPDFYHTCYCLSGLSIAQHYYIYDTVQEDFKENQELTTIVGKVSNLIKATHPVHNISISKAKRIMSYFENSTIVNIGSNESLSSSIEIITNKNKDQEEQQ